jgi:hypothetical protein
MRGRHAVPFVVAIVAACSRASAPPTHVTPRMDFARPDFYAAPFPSDDLLHDGRVAIAGFPNPGGVQLVTEGTTLLARDARGFATTGAVFFALDGAIDPSRLPTMTASVDPSSPVFLVDADTGSPDFGKRVPVSVAFEADGGPFGAPNLLSLLPLQGAPLRPSTLYAAVVTKGAASPPLVAAPAMTDVAAGKVPSPSYARAFAALQAMQVDTSSIAAMVAFTTDDPTAGLAKVVADMLARPAPTPGAWTLTDTFPEYCVYKTTIGMPDYQEGTPPFTETGGDWTFDASGEPVVQRVDASNLVVTIPRAAAPANGWPTTIFIRTGAGGDRPLVDRGVQPGTGQAAVTPGTGPAVELARAGFAGIQVDGPLGGLRNPTNANEDFTIFNVFNATALRDNVRESAAELVLLAHVIDGIAIDASACGGAAPSTVRLTTSTLALFGHSMGASILPLTLAFEPRIQAAILSGAGSSWIENVMYKQQPLPVKGALEFLLGYQGERSLTDHDPVLTLFQWAEEPADSQVYARRLVREPPPGYAPRNVLMVQGIVDHYILPPIADAFSASAGLDLAGPELDTTVPEIASMMPVSATFPFSGRGAIGFPARANASGATAVVVQWPSDGIEDGHEVIFQTHPPKYQYKCFLASLLAGAPSVPDGAGKTEDDACP